MALRISAITILIFTCLSFANAQEWRLHLNGNEYYPINAEEKGYYPILWYSSAEGRGVLVGGFGGGVSWSKPLKGKWDLKAQFNLFRSRYYDEPVIILDENGQPLGAAIGIATNLNLTALGIPKFSVAKWLDVGAGLGVQGILLSKSDYGEAVVQGGKRDLKFTNKSQKPLVLLLPAEITAHFGRFSISTRAEFSLTKASRLPYASKERFVTLFIEAGYRLGKTSTDQ